MTDLRSTCTAAPGIFLVSEGNTVVASVHAERIGAGKELADAMAAAPELLEALEVFAKIDTAFTQARGETHQRTKLAVSDILRAQAAVAKAKGGAA